MHKVSLVNKFRHWLENRTTQIGDNLNLQITDGDLREQTARLVITPQNIPKFTIPVLCLNDRPLTTSSSKNGEFIDAQLIKFDQDRNSDASDLSKEETCWNVDQLSNDGIYGDDVLHITATSDVSSCDSSTSKRRLAVSSIWQNSLDKKFVSCNSEILKKTLDNTNVDPFSISALELTHFKSKTSYGFDTLHTLPNTQRRESLFHESMSGKVGKRHVKIQQTVEVFSLQRRQTATGSCGVRSCFAPNVSRSHSQCISISQTIHPDSARTPMSHSVIKKNTSISIFSIFSAKNSRQANTNPDSASKCESTRPELGQLHLKVCYISQSQCIIIHTICFQDLVKLHTGTKMTNSFLKIRLDPGTGQCEHITGVMDYAIQSRFDDFVCFRHVKRQEVDMMTLFIQCCSTGAYKSEEQTWGEVIFSLADLTPNKDHSMTNIIEGIRMNNEIYVRILSKGFAESLYILCPVLSIIKLFLLN
jgi:hypothetical protein